MLKTLHDFLEFAGGENKKKFIISIWLELLNSIANALKIPAVMYIIMGLINGDEIKSYIIGSLIIMAVSLVVSIATKAIISVLETEAGYGSCAYKRIEMAEHLRFVPMGYFNKNTIGEISSVMTNTIESLSNLATRVVMVSTQGILETLMITVFLFVFDWRIGIIGTVGLVVFLLVNTKLQKSGGPRSDKKNECDTEMVSQIVEYLKGISEVKSYGLFGAKAKKFNEANEACRKSNIALEVVYQPWLFLQGVIVKFIGAAIIIASIVFYLNGSMNLITAIGMTICAFILFVGLETFGNFTSLLHLVQGYMDKANGVLSLPEMDIDGKDIKPANLTIDFANADFSYNTKKIIDDVSLSIPENKTTAFVGPSGGGKTTLAHLAARFWDVDKGSVSLGGINVKDYSFNSLMDNFSFVFQDVYLFSDTIENNIRFGRENATREEVVHAAKLACCDDFINALPQGYDTIIGEGGTSLSGGEMQRLSIARAILKDAPIIILDEATANVDPENEEYLMKAIQVLTKDKTVIMIAHRLKTVRNADQIVVINNGRIEDVGTHDSLINKNGIYRTFIEARKCAINWQIEKNK